MNSIPKPDHAPTERFASLRTTGMTHWFILISSLILGTMVNVQSEEEAPIPIGSRLELFVDDTIIHSLSGKAMKRLHHPVRKEIAVVHDAPWEGNGGNYHAIFQDGDLYRMYYHAWQIPGSSGEPTHPLYIAYCESKDGIRWVKPALNRFEFEGSKKNNIVLTTVNGSEPHDLSPFIDTNPKTKSKYKAVGLCQNPAGLYGFRSDNAIDWEVLNDDKPIMTGHPFDTQNIVFWDAAIGKYRAYIRDFHKGPPSRRGIMTAVSDDFIHWSKRRWLEFGSAPKEELYTNQVRPYYRAPHIYVGFPSRYIDRGWGHSTETLPQPAERKTRSKGSRRYGSAVTDALLMTSRDGIHFNRWEEAFLKPGLRTRHNWSYGDNYLAWHIVETDSADDDMPRELSLYATESYFTGKMSRLRRYSLRIDGFVSINAPVQGGEIVTQPLVFAGSELKINFSTAAAGSIHVELQDENGEALAGFGRSNCHEIFGDSLEHLVAWKENPDLGRLAGQTIRLRFILKEADLYSFKFH